MPRATPPPATHHDYTGQLKWVQACFPFPKANHVPLKGASKQNTSGNSLGVCVFQSLGLQDGKVCQRGVKDAFHFQLQEGFPKYGCCKLLRR